MVLVNTIVIAFSYFSPSFFQIRFFSNGGVGEQIFFMKGGGGCNTKEIYNYILHNFEFHPSPIHLPGKE